MRFYSDLLHKFYDSDEDCIKAEKNFQKEQELKKKSEEEKSKARKAAADKVEEARKAYIDAKKKYYEELSDFCEKYDYYHISFDKKDLAGLIDNFWDMMF